MIISNEDLQYLRSLLGTCQESLHAEFCYYDKCSCFRFNRAFKILDKLEKNHAHSVEGKCDTSDLKWASIETPPKVNGYYLCVCREIGGDYMCTMRYIKCGTTIDARRPYVLPEDKWTVWMGTTTSMNGVVVFWMPLPPPPSPFNGD